jgi:hypothetical protein
MTSAINPEVDNMMRRVISLLLAVLMLCGILSACSIRREPAEESFQPVIILDGDTPSETAKPDSSQTADAEEPAEITEDGEYSTPEEVAEYIHTFGHLPGNYITKGKAENLGWDSSKGNLWDVAPGKSIGGNRYGNYEGALPKGSYKECDVNYNGGYRGPERLVYDDQGHVYYTEDHYKTFVQLY